MIQAIKNMFMPSSPASSNLVIPNNSTIIPNGNHTKLSNETYHQYGVRICGLVTANIDFLTVFFQKIYQAEKQRFIADQQFQANAKIEIQNKITSCETEKDQKQTSLEHVKDDIAKRNEQINEHKGEIEAIKRRDSTQNKEHRIKFWLGAIILLILTIYLFIFYSSTFYSAFFKDFIASGTTGVGTAMFDPSSLGNALKNGIGELVFICTAPVIFMALGFALHYFNIQKGYGKYLKAGSCIFVTFIFDCILAYLIGKNIYSVEALNTLQEMPEYNMSMAINDPNIWAVIFCGFITYMIWGVVLDMTISAYNDMKFNKSEIRDLENKIEKLKDEIGFKNQALQKLENEISAINGEIIKLKNSLTMVQIPNELILSSISDFFAGWSQIATTLNANYNTIEAQKSFDTFIKSINS